MKTHTIRLAVMAAVASATLAASDSDSLAALAYYPVQDTCPYSQELEEGMPVDYDYWRFNECEDTASDAGFWHWLLKHLGAK